jgi:hypothetical protein
MTILGTQVTVPGKQQLQAGINPGKPGTQWHLREAARFSDAHLDMGCTGRTAPHKRMSSCRLASSCDSDVADDSPHQLPFSVCYRLQAESLVQLRVHRDSLPRLHTGAMAVLQRLHWLMVAGGEVAGHQDRAAPDVCCSMLRCPSRSGPGSTSCIKTEVKRATIWCASHVRMHF